MDKKRARGQFYTRGNPFALDPFTQWAKQAGLPDALVLEPFAGANHIINTLTHIGVCRDFASYDLAPDNAAVRKRNTLKNFPKGFKVCITNPPWLARNSATRRRLPYPATEYDDLYKHCLALCLNHCPYVAALIPASYLQTGLFQNRLSSYVLLHYTLFSDTENPVCLALFDDHSEAGRDVAIYYDNEFKGTLNGLRRNLPDTRRHKHLKFNDPDGTLGFVSFDNTRAPSIKFCEVEEIADYPIKVSSRFITRISGEFNTKISTLIKKLNKDLERFRLETHDVFLTPFKGLRDDQCYRRRMDFNLARKFINAY